MRIAEAIHWAPGLLAAALLACGGGGTSLRLFSTDWEDDGGASIARVYQRVGNTPPPAGADVVVGVTGNSNALVGLPLGGGAKWTFPHAVDTRPIVAGAVVVGSGGGEVFALDAKTGSKLWARQTGDLPLLGAGDDGTVTVVTMRQAGGAGSVLLAVTHEGEVVRQIETEKPLGAPAVVQRLAFVPWSSQYISVVDLSSGDEAARVTLRQQVSHAWTQSGSLWFGEAGYVRFDEHIRDASRGQASHLELPQRELPATPKLMAPGGTPVPATANAEDKTRLYARPIPGAGGAGGVGIDDGRWYGTYFRLAMAFTVDKAKLAWVHLHEADFVGGAAAGGGVVLCDEQGKVEELDAQTGGVLATLDLGQPVKSCVVAVDGQHLSGTPKDAKPLVAQLADAVLANEPQLAIAQKLLLRELAAMDDEAATKALVDLASNPQASPDLLVDANISLANRRNGATYMEAALDRRYDYMKDVLRPPPVAPIAQALAAMKEKAAAPRLAAHLLDPADTDEDVKQTAAALAVVGGAGELPAMKQFFAMYRATAANDDLAAAVVSIGQALVTLGDKQGRAAVEAAVKDPMTVPYAKERLQAVLSAAATGAGDGKNK
jgi:outer membrane protein assembly factor BamB